jgi:outer membrane receptor protein involved in Fe transport
MMKTRSTRSLAAAFISSTALIAPGLTLALVGAPTTAAAQAAPAKPAEAATQVEEVVVTGTRIRGTTNATSAAPISIATSDQIALTKADTIEEALSRMTGPDFTGGISTASNNGGDGLSEVSLRNLGPARTLVLIDGQRLIPIFSNATSVPDLNSVPLAMVDRIEVLRDGASSLYGADAIGGVINIITKKNASGMTFDTSVGESGHGDGLTYSFSGTVASNSDRGNIMIGLGWDHRDAIAQSARSWATDLHANDPNYPGGSAYRYQLDLLQNELTNDVWAGGVNYQQYDPALAGLAPNLGFLPGVSLGDGLPNGAVVMNAGGPGWNSLTGEMDRKQISFTGHYDLTDNVRFVASGFFSERTSEQKLRPEPILGDAIATIVDGQTVYPGFVVPDFAPGNTTGQDILAFLTPVQFGPRDYKQTSDTYRIRFGFEGTVAGKWNWELGFVEQENRTEDDIGNSGNWQHLGQMTGQYACINVPGGCVPNTLAPSDPHSLANGGPATLPAQMPNFFNGPNMFTPAQVAYLTFTARDHNASSERYAYADVNGPLFDLPYGTVKGALGVEYRQEYLSDNPDPLVAEGYAANTTQTTGGGYNVGAVYGELNIPVLTNLPLAKSLTIDPSVRWDDYSTFGSATTYKIAVNYEITRDIRVRASYSTGFRAPSTAELFGGNAITDLTASGDPCDTRSGINGNVNAGTGLTASGSKCAIALAAAPNSGAVFTNGALTQFFSGNNSQKDAQEQVLIGGNKALQPEKSVDWGIGGVITPRFIPGLSLEIDYYNDTINNTILSGGYADAATSPGPDLVLNGCYGAAQNQTFCSLIHRNAAGSIVQIDSLNANFGIEKVSGIDYELTYDTGLAHLDLPFPGAIKIDLEMSQLLNHTNQNPDGTVNVAQGTFQYTSEAIQPVWKGQLAVDYRLHGWTAHYDMRYLGGTKNIDGSAAVYGNETPDIFYHDIAISYAFDKLGFAKQAKFTFGVDNLADQNPPFLGADSVCKCNTLAGPYDVVGRFFYARLSTKF